MGVRRPGAAATRDAGFTNTKLSPNGDRGSDRHAKDYVSVGRATDNDVVVMSPAVAPYHLGIVREGDEVWLRRTDPLARTFLNGEEISRERTRIANGAAVSFLPPALSGPTLVLEWSDRGGHYRLERFDNLTKLLWLSSVNMFRSLELATIAEIAATAEVRLYEAGAWICRAGESSQEAFLLQTGSAAVVAEDGGTGAQLGSLSTGAIVGELGVITGRERAASVRVTSPNARVVTINGERLRRLMSHDPLVSMNMLVVVANYIKH
jgi:hypothetical protein